jgi:hypothetical protein
MLKIVKFDYFERFKASAGDGFRAEVNNRSVLKKKKRGVFFLISEY